MSTHLRTHILLYLVPQTLSLVDGRGLAEGENAWLTGKVHETTAKKVIGILCSEVQCGHKLDNILAVGNDDWKQCLTSRLEGSQQMRLKSDRMQRELDWVWGGMDMYINECVYMQEKRERERHVKKWGNSCHNMC